MKKERKIGDKDKQKQLEIVKREYTKEEKKKEEEYFNGFVNTLTLMIRKYGDKVLGNK